MSDGQLLETVLSDQGEQAEAAFSTLVAVHGPMVWNVCQSILSDQHSAEDAFQATFLVLVRRAGSIRRRDAVGPWLYGVSRRIAVRAKAIEARRPQGERCARELTSSDPDPAEHGQFEALHEEVARLAERYRAPLVLCYFEGRSHVEAARLLRCPVGTVSVRLARARSLLRSRLTRRGVVLPGFLFAASLGNAANVAAIPLAVVESTTRAAMSLASGKLVVAEMASASIMNLVRWEAEAMIFKGMTWAAMGLLAVAAAGLSIGRLATDRRSEPPPVVRARGARRPTNDLDQTLSHLKTIGRGMFDYAARHNGTFPAAAIRKDGQPLLSWRVALLPDINQGVLYRRFHLDEPWDSLHNKTLLDQMPDIYAPTSSATKSGHSTHLQVFTGPSTLFGGRGGPKLGSIKDGLSTTIMVVEAARPVPWTKPEDLPSDSETPMLEQLGRFGDGFCAGFADGSGRFIQRTINPNILRALMTPTGGEKITFDQF